MNKRHEFLFEIENYYLEKFNTYGSTAMGVDWNSEIGQILRFEQLCRIILNEPDSKFSVLDVGCGYGALFDFLKTKKLNFSYLGLDICSTLIDSAIARNQQNDNTTFICAQTVDTQVNYAIASGIFNVRLQKNNHEWIDYVKSTLDFMNEVSINGFAFNCLTSYSDSDKKKSHLFYADPCFIFDFCKKRYSKNIALLHDYGLYEFTCLVRK